MEMAVCEIPAAELEKALAQERVIILGTGGQGRVSLRPVSYVSWGLTLYFQTGKSSLKVRQMGQNPQVALGLGTYQLEGAATFLGHPLEEKNEFFARAYQEKHPESYQDYSAMQEEILVKVQIQKARQWRYEQGKPLMAKANFAIQSRCGIVCAECGEKPQGAPCPGCLALQQPFWGDCPVKNCCQQKNLACCGDCANFPCELLHTFAYDPQQGDEGRRLQQCKEWCAV